MNKILLQFIEPSHNMSVHYYYVPTISMAEIKDPLYMIKISYKASCFTTAIIDISVLEKFLYTNSRAN